MKTGIIVSCGEFETFSDAIAGGLFDGDDIEGESATVPLGLLNWFSWSTEFPIKRPTARPLTFVNGLGIGIRCSKLVTIGFWVHKGEFSRGPKSLRTIGIFKIV